MNTLRVFFCAATASLLASATVLPSRFDLRDVSGDDFTTAVKSQSGGTCWTHGTMASIESNLMKTGTWQSSGESGEANLAEYHLDWWNGFNRNYNSDIAPTAGGLTVHEGGDYRVAAAYLTRGAGSVRDVDAQSFSSAPQQSASGYHYYYVRDIQWMDVGPNLENIAQMKQAIMDHGVVGTALTWSSSFYSSSSNTFYQPSSSASEPNHAVAIAGWDDNKRTQSAQPGAWLVKNSWGSSWGDDGYFWISYYDKIAGHHPEMGAVSFQNVERMKYKKVYSHDYHGWRDTKQGVTEAFNAFTSQGGEQLKSASFYTATNNVSYEVRVYKNFAGGELSDLQSTKAGTIAGSGFHTVDLDNLVTLQSGEKFYVYVKLSNGGHAFDRTSNVPVLLGSLGRVTVESRAKAGESFYRNGGAWVDLTQDNATANFCIKALTVS